MKDNSRAAAEDWVCLHCNNLNYSFRKICNRCKITTREENHKYRQLQYYNIYYNSHYYSLPEATPHSQQLYSPHSVRTPSKQHMEGSAEIASAPRKWSESATTHPSTPSKRHQTADQMMALVPNAWESLQICQQPLSCYSESSGQNLSQDWESDRSFLPNFDLTFL